MDEDDLVGFDRARTRIYHTIQARPEDGFTAETLSRILGLPSFEVRDALEELTADGLVTWIDGEYVSTLSVG